MARALIALGGNLGDSRALIEGAIRDLARVGTVAARSALYRTPPLGPPQPDYLNAAVALETDLSAEALLAELARMEGLAGRVPGERWGPRTLDLDLLLHGDRIVQAPGLQLPHPELHKRAFVLVPLADIAADVRHPLLGRTIAELRDALDPGEIAAIARLDSSGDTR